MSEFSELIYRALKFPQYKIWGYDKVRKLSIFNDTDFRKGWRAMAAHSHVFHITDDCLWAAVQLMEHIDPYILYQETLAARMPFECTVFQYNVRTKCKFLEEFGARVEDVEEGEDPNDQASWLVIATDTHTGCRSVASMCWKGHVSLKSDKKLMMFPASIIIDSPRHPEGGKGFVDWLWTSDIAKRYPESVKKIDSERRLGFGLVGPVGDFLKFAQIYGGELKKKKLFYLTEQDFYNALYEGTGGEFRFYAALCMLLNRPATVRYVARPATAPQVVGERDKEDDHEDKELVLMVPRERIINLCKNPRKPRGPLTEAHEVEGHWAHFHKDDLNGCHHHWPNEPTRRQRCTKCGALRWFKVEHKRGPGEVKPKERKIDYSGSGISVKEMQS